MRQAPLLMISLLSCALSGCDDADGSADARAAVPDGSYRDASPLLLESAALCDDGQDNDGDGFTDCEDQDCWPQPVCAENGDADSRASDSTVDSDAAAPPEDAGGPDASDSGSADGPCVPQSYTLAIVTPSGGSACSFPFSKAYTPGLVNLLLTPGWGTVCYAGSSSNCGSGASADGWWFSGGEIALCDRTCERFWAQTQAGKLTVQLGCPTEDCTH